MAIIAAVNVKSSVRYGDTQPWLEINLDVNGKVHAVDADPDMPLLYALRNDLGLNNPHFGCGLAQCGACTVHVDGAAGTLLRHAAFRGRQRQGRDARGSRHAGEAAPDADRPTSRSRCRNAAIASTAGS